MLPATTPSPHELYNGRQPFGATGRRKLQRPDEALHRLACLTEDLYRRLRLDPLTEIVNRQSFRSELQARIEQGEEMALVLLDLDHFKAVNDAYGHCTGDHVVQIIAKRLSDTFDDAAVLGRMGGDAFAILLLGRFDGEQLAAIGQRALEAVRAPISCDSHVLKISASVGIARCPEHGDSGSTLLTNVGLALLEAKNNGRNSANIFSASLRSALVLRQRLLDELGTACHEKQFELHYQPQFELGSRRITGAEALLRWQHPQRGLILPADFLETLENSAWAAPVGRWILEGACRQSALWQTRLPDGFRISVNLFGSQLLADGFDTDVLNTLQTVGVPPGSLELEITENTLLDANANLYSAMKRLFDAGVGIALDDYGTGYASLSLLKRLAITRLKIDRSFISDIADNDADAAVVRAILFLGRNFGLSVVAEGIETIQQENRLLDLGCQRGQGYLCAEPLSATAFAARLLG
jgi:diguanylate cyclase (GGDEF)-like protein